MLASSAQIVANGGLRRTPPAKGRSNGREVRGHVVASASTCSPDGDATGKAQLSGFRRYLQAAKAANAQRVKSVVTERVRAERHRELRALMARMSAERHGAHDSHLASLLASAPPATDDDE